jgi:hypothetical protein
MAPIIEKVQLSPREAFEKKVENLQLQLGEAFYGLFGDGERSAGILKGLASVIKEKEGFQKDLISRITTDGEIDYDKVVSVGDKWTTDDHVMSLFTDPKTGKTTEYKLSSYVGEILRSSVLLREAVLKTGGVYKSGDMTEELRFARKESSYRDSISIVESRSLTLQDLTDVYKNYDLSEIVNQIKEENKVSPDLQSRLYVAVLLSSLKSDAVYSSDNKRSTVDRLIMAGKLPSEYQYDSEAGVLSGGEVEYAKYLAEEESRTEGNKGMRKGRISDGNVIKRYFVNTHRFRLAEDTFYETLDESGKKDKCQIVAVIEGKEKGQMYGVTDTKLIVVKRNGEWSPVVINRKIKGLIKEDLARAQDVLDGSISFINFNKEGEERRTEIQIVPMTTESILTGQRGAVSKDAQLIKAVEARNTGVTDRIKEIAKWANPIIEPLDRPVVVEVVRDGKKESVKMVGRTINFASSDLSAVVNFESHGPQSWIGEDGNLYTRLMKAEDRDGNKALNLNFVDLRNGGKEVAARNDINASYYATTLNIFNLVEEGVGRVDEEHGQNWVLIDKRWKDKKRKDRQVNMYVIEANVGKNSSLDEQTQAVVGVDKLPYAKGSEPNADTPTIIDIPVEGDGNILTRSGRAVVLALSNIGSGGEKFETTHSIDVSKLDQIVQRRRMTTLRAIASDIEGAEVIPAGREMNVISGKGSAFLMVDNHGENTNKKTDSARVRMFLSKTIRPDLTYFVDIRGNVYTIDQTKQIEPATYHETVPLSGLKEALI